MCPICEGTALERTEWKSHLGAHWPAVRCADCGAITREKHHDGRLAAKRAADRAPKPPVNELAILALFRGL